MSIQIDFIRIKFYVYKLPLNRRSHFGKRPLANVKSPQCDQNDNVTRKTAKHNKSKTTFKFNRIIIKYKGYCCCCRK